MSNSTPTYDPIVQSQSSKEVTANAYFDAVSPASFLRVAAIDVERPELEILWRHAAGRWRADSDQQNVLALAASSNNYIEIARAVVISRNSSGFTPGSIPLYLAVTGASTVTSYTDYRAWVQVRDQTSKASVAVTAADVTLTADQARCRHLTTTGVLNANRTVIVPNNWEGIVFFQ